MREFPNLDCYSQYILKSHPIYSHGLAPCVNKMFVQKYFLTVSVWVKKCHESFKQSVMVSYLWVEIPSYIVYIYSIYFCILAIWKCLCQYLDLFILHPEMFYAIVETHVKIMKRYIRYPLIFRIVQSPLRTWIRYNGHDDWMIFYGIYCRWKLGTGRLPCFADSSRWPWLLYDSLDVGRGDGTENVSCLFMFVHVCSTWPLQL